jgi:hypothetical protein
MKDESGLIPIKRAMIVWNEDRENKLKITETKVYCIPEYSKIKGKSECRHIMLRIEERYKKYAMSHGCCSQMWKEGNMNYRLSFVIDLSMQGFSNDKSRKEFYYEISKIKEFNFVRQAYLKQYVREDLQEEVFSGDFCDGF